MLTIRVGFYYLSEANRPAPVSGSKIRIVGLLSSQPRLQGSLQRFKMGAYQIYAPVKPVFHYGDKIELTGKSSEGGAVFYPEIKILQPSATGFWWNFSDHIRSQAIRTYQRVLPKTEADLLSGIVLGSASLNRNFKNELAKVGLTHVVAASGMNVSFFSAAVLGLLTLFGGGKMLKFAVMTGFILFYATMTGFEPPILRAGFMAVLIYAASLTGRQISGGIGLATSAFIMLWAWPELLTSASFLLSFSAMASQIFAGTIKVSLPKLFRGIIELFLQSGSALVFTFPIVLIFFSTFSLISLFTNVLVLWTIEPLMILGSLIATLGFFFMPISYALGVPAAGLLDFFLWVVNTFGQSELSNRLQLHPAFSNNLNAVLFAAGYYFLLAGLIWWWRRRRAVNIIRPHYD